MFTADVQVSKTTQGYERRLRELEEAGDKPTLTFERNKSLADLKSKVKSLGSLTLGRLNVSDDTADENIWQGKDTVFRPVKQTGEC